MSVCVLQLSPIRFRCCHSCLRARKPLCACVSCYVHVRVYVYIYWRSVCMINRVSILSLQFDCLSFSLSLCSCLYLFIPFVLPVFLRFSPPLSLSPFISLSRACPILYGTIRFIDGHVSYIDISNTRVTTTTTTTILFVVVVVAFSMVALLEVVSGRCDG